VHDMSLEEEVVAMEEEAAASVAAARQEAKRILATIDGLKKKIREETAARLEREIASLKEERAAELARRLEEVRRERERELAGVARAAEGRARRLAAEIVSALLEK